MSSITETNELKQDLLIGAIALRGGKFVDCYVLEREMLMAGETVHYVGGQMHRLLESCPEIIYSHWCGGTNYRVRTEEEKRSLLGQAEQPTTATHEPPDFDEDYEG